MCIFHKWTKWSKPYERTFDFYDAIFSKYKTVRGEIQDKTCEKCGKYKWRKV